MLQARLHALSALRRLRRLALGVCLAGLPQLAPAGEIDLTPRPVLTLVAEPTESEKEAAPPPRAEPVLLPAPSGKGIPVSLDAVFRLAADQNPQVRLAREKVHGAAAEQALACYAWLPRLYVGPSWYRHEGGIQDQDGRFIHSSTGAIFAGAEVHSILDVRDVVYQRFLADRALWQQKGELSKISSEQLLDATQVYIDLLLARAGEQVSQHIEARLRELLELGQKRRDYLTGGQLETIEAEILNQQQVGRKLRQLGCASAARLTYLLGLPPGAELMPVESQLLPFDLVDASKPCDYFVQQALTNGPGVRELQGMIAVMHQSMDRSTWFSRIPVIETRIGEGLFGAGPGASTTWDNRFDLGLQVRWDIGGFITAKERQRVAESKLHQVYLSHQDLCAKLTAGVEEARDAILSNRELIARSQEQLQHVRKAYESVRDRIDRRPQEPGPYSDALNVLRLLREAEQNLLSSIVSYDKAQLRLIVLLGPTAAEPVPGACCPR